MGEVEVLGLRKLEDALHSIIVRQSAPDWLPFVPGSSYWSLLSVTSLIPGSD